MVQDFVHPQYGSVWPFLVLNFWVTSYASRFSPLKVKLISFKPPPSLDSRHHPARSQLGKVAHRFRWDPQIAIGAKSVGKVGMNRGGFPYRKPPFGIWMVYTILHGSFHLSFPAENQQVLSGSW